MDREEFFCGSDMVTQGELTVVLGHVDDGILKERCEFVNEDIAVPPQPAIAVFRVEDPAVGGEDDADGGTFDI